jgi:hypothetical protein
MTPEFRAHESSLSETQRHVLCCRVCVSNYLAARDGLCNCRAANAAAGLSELFALRVGEKVQP